MQRHRRAETYEKIKRAATENRVSEQMKRADMESIIRYRENIQSSY
jgi:hypothetical protein